MRKIVISGGPHSGKTTIFDALQSDFTDAYFVPEPAETVIRRELGRQALDTSYTPKVPWIDYTAFAPLVVAESIALEEAIPETVDVSFQDRSLIDNIAYRKLNDMEHSVQEVHELAVAANYSLALFCEPVGSYATTQIRREVIEEARLTHDYLTEAYDQFPIQVIHLPAVSVKERLQIIHSAVDN